jgi:polyisoprenoid-binding protein YceI
MNRATTGIMRGAAVAAAAAAAAGLMWTPAELPPARAAAGLPVRGFTIVPGRSSVTFAVPDNRGGFSGHTAQITGRVDVEPAAGNAYTAAITASVDARSLTTDNTLRDRAMHATFLQTATYPAILFAGTATAHPPAGVRSFPADVRGRLTIRDQARDADFRASVTAPSAGEYVADATAQVRMADYGIPYPRAFIFVARDPVTVTLHLVARADR